MPQWPFLGADTVIRTGNLKGFPERAQFASLLYFYEYVKSGKNAIMKCIRMKMSWKSINYEALKFRFCIPCSNLAVISKLQDRDFLLAKARIVAGIPQLR